MMSPISVSEVCDCGSSYQTKPNQTENRTEIDPFFVRFGVFSCFRFKFPRLLLAKGEMAIGG
jgi:hypothetical protein